MTSVTSGTAFARRRASWTPLAIRIASTYGLLVLLAVLVLAFSIALPDTFPTKFNVRTLLADQSVIVLLALAVMVPMAAGQFDLSVGYLVGLTHILVVGFQTRNGLPWGVTALLVLVLGALVGLLNGLIVTRAHVDSFIATLGVGTVCFGVAEWYTGGQQVLGDLSQSFLDFTQTATVWGWIPAPAWYALGICVLLYLVFDYLPVGRYLYVLGANPRAAELTGISARRYVPLAFMVSGLLTAFAGIVLASRLRVGQPSVGPDYLLQSFAGALLGATAIRPGRVNVGGTVVAVFLLAVAVSGLTQMGVEFFIQPLFNGSMLVIAVALAVYAARRRVAAATAAPAAEPERAEAGPT